MTRFTKKGGKKGGKVETRSHHPRNFSNREYEEMRRTQESGRRRARAPEVVVEALRNERPTIPRQPARRRRRVAPPSPPVFQPPSPPRPLFEDMVDDEDVEYEDLTDHEEEFEDVIDPEDSNPPDTLDPALVPAANRTNIFGYSVNNLYIYPNEVMDWLVEPSNHLMFPDGKTLNLTALRGVLNEIEANPRDVSKEQRSFFGVTANRVAHKSDFIEFELTRFLTGKYGFNTRSSKNIWPYLSSGKLVIPCSDVRDLSLYIMFYILKKLANSRVDHVGIFTYSLESRALAIQGQTTLPIYRRDGQLAEMVDHTITLQDLLTIYTDIISNFAANLPDNEGRDDFQITWNGGVSSGTRVRLLNWGKPKSLNLLYLTLYVKATHGQRPGARWTQAIEDFIRNTMGSSVISVRNRDDDRCLLYCIIIGIFLKVCKGTNQIFGNKQMIEASEIYAKSTYMFSDKGDPVSVCLRHLSRCLITPSYSTGEVDPIVEFVRDLDKKVSTMMSISGFREGFKEIEEKLIPNGVCGIDVYGIDYNVNKHIYPLYVSKNREKVISLVCVTPPMAGFSHYCLINNFEKLLQRTGGKQFFSCSKCGECFYHKRLLQDHHCSADMDAAGVMEGDGDYHYSVKYADPEIDVVVGVCPKCRLAFVNEFQYEYHKAHCLMKGITGYRHVQLVAYGDSPIPTLTGEELDVENEDKHISQRRVLYADFESSIDPETGVHSFMSYGLYDWEDDFFMWGYSLDKFMKKITEIAFKNDEEHIYVYFHNAMGYDANFILKYVMKTPECANWGIQVIMKSSNRLQKLVFYIHQDDKRRVLHICDTFMFLTLSLEKIVGSIRKDDLEANEENFSRFFQTFRRLYPTVSDEDIDHILRKNIFPYKFFTDSSKLDTHIDDFIKIFEPKEENLKFFSERVTLEDLQKSYDDTKHVIETFVCLSARDYHDLYLCCDVLQLADVFDRSMNILWESHHIHLTRYLGMPSASWAAFLRHDPSMKIPLYEDTFFAEFFKEMIRGGITSAPLRYAEADENHSIIYLDVNGLYPYVMQAYKFPCGRFMTVPLGWGPEESKVRLFELFEQFERESKGMCFCVDLHIPDSVKEVTDMYPFAPEHRRIFKEYFQGDGSKTLTPFLQKWSEANDGETMSEFKGLVCTLYDKTKYNVHWRLLKFYMEHGVEVTKVYFGVSFDEGEYLRGYIRKNIEIRNGRKDELGKTLYKLLGNSIYGKTFESPFKRNTYEIVRDPIRMEGLLEEGNIAAMTPIDDLGWIVKMDGEDIVLDKPTYIGACVCEFSKLHMYTLLYDKLAKIFPGTPDDPGCRLVYTDTDSFIVRVKHPPEVPGFDPPALFAYIKSCDPTLIGGIGGQVKSETGEDDTIKKIIALRSKVYAYKTLHKHLGKRAKGTTHDAQEMQLSWKSYKETLRNLRAFDTRSSLIQRATFNLTSEDVTRRSLSVNDGKRFICEDGIETFAFGNPKIELLNRSPSISPAP